MAKKQTRRSISVSRTTYERLKAFCEANNISMSQLVETRVNDFLAVDSPPVDDLRRVAPRPIAPVASSTPPMRPLHGVTSMSSVGASPSMPRPTAEPAPRAATPVVPMTSAAARFVVEPPPPIIKPKQETAAPKPVEKRPEQIFTF